jgi:hypothetical protein
MRSAYRGWAPCLAAGAVLLFVLGCGRGAGTETALKPSDTTATPAPPEPAKPEAADGAKQAAAPAKDDDSRSYDPATAAGAVKGIPAPTNTGSIEAVANFFADMPGFDLNALGKHGKEKFLHRVNSELCTCGCKNDTLARCYVNDPKCPVVKGMVQAVYDEVKSGS